jgi:hypothetical protein
MAIEEASLTAALPDGTQVYEAGEVRVERNAPPVATVCTSAVLLAGNETSPSLIKRARRMRGMTPVGNAVAKEALPDASSP